MSHSKHSPPAQVEVPVALKVAIQELISRVGGDGFLMELQTDDGHRYYLAYGTPDTIRGFLDPVTETAPGSGLPSIH